MKGKMSRIVGVTLIVALSFLLVSAQEIKTVSQTSKPDAKISPATTKQEAQEMRKQELAVLRDHILTRTLRNIRSMDEAALRVSARNQIIEYLAEANTSFDAYRAMAHKITLENLADFSEHNEQIPPFMANYLLGDLGAWIQKYEPELTEEFKVAERTRIVVKENDRIRSLLELKDGDVLAAQRIRQLLGAGQDVEGLNFYLDELMRRNSKELEPLLSDVLASAARGPAPSLETLYWVSHIYLSPQVSKTAKQRFLSVILKRTQPANFIVESPPKIAYDLLADALPAIRELIPEFYDQAAAQSFALRATLNERQLANDERAKRIRESVNPVEDLVAEAETVKSKSERNELLAAAARLALEKKKFAVCLDVVARLDLEVAASSADFWRNWTDQFLKDFVKATIAVKDTGLAEKGTERIRLPFARVESLALIMRYFGKVNDKTTAQRLLAEASKIAGSASDDIQKAKAFFLLSLACDQADESQRAPLLEFGIKALNNLSKPDTEGNDKKPYEQYVRSLDNAGNELRKSFKGLTKQDENGTIALIEKVQKPDLRTFAMIGFLQGLDQLFASVQD